jgi:hypothetical protein
MAYLWVFLCSKKSPYFYIGISVVKDDVKYGELNPHKYKIL